MRIEWYRCRPRGQIEHSDTRRSARGKTAIDRRKRGSGLGRALQRPESDVLSLPGRQALPTPTMETVGVHDVDVLRRVDRLVAEAALVGGEDVAASPRERGRLAPATRADRAVAPEGRVVGDGRGHETHFREAHGTGKGQAGVTQGFAGALLEQSADGHREFRGETVGRSAVRRQPGRSTNARVEGRLTERGAGGARSSPPAQPAPASPPRRRG